MDLSDWMFQNWATHFWRMSLTFLLSSVYSMIVHGTGPMSRVSLRRLSTTEPEELNSLFRVQRIQTFEECYQCVFLFFFYRILEQGPKTQNRSRPHRHAPRQHENQRIVSNQSDPSIPSLGFCQIKSTKCAPCRRMCVFRAMSLKLSERPRRYHWPLIVGVCPIIPPAQPPSVGQRSPLPCLSFHWIQNFLLILHRALVSRVCPNIGPVQLIGYCWSIWSFLFHCRSWFWFQFRFATI